MFRWIQKEFVCSSQYAFWFGIGLFSFVSDDTIVALADPDDENADGISGRVNFEQGERGRFGYKARLQPRIIRRGAMINQMGNTSITVLRSS